MNRKNFKMKSRLIKGQVQINNRLIPIISTEYGVRDISGAIMVRWGINRNNYRVTPGLYAIGAPDGSSDIFVTANYKLSFDHVRKNLSGINCWVLVLDTKGVNVWCAAGKGTFGTKELVNRIIEVSLDTIVNHKRIILPQLGATGVAAHKVKEETGFNVHYGPVRASDIKRFIIEGYRADKKMRKVTFGLKDRLKLVPNDFIYGKFYLLGAFVFVFLVSFIRNKGALINDSVNIGLTAMLNIFFAYFAGIVITPILLPYLPGRRFSLKGFFAGAVIVLFLFIINRTIGHDLYEKIAWFMIIPVISSFMAMNFTGSSTYTSLSGVKKEMKTAVPLQITFSVLGVILLVIGKFIK
jgi:hypothetical protein